MALLVIIYCGTAFVSASVSASVGARHIGGSCFFYLMYTIKMHKTRCDSCRREIKDDFYGLLRAAFLLVSVI